MYSIFHIDGGIGKNIMATSVISSLKKSDAERKIIIVTPWPAVWLNNPNIFQVVPSNQLTNFYTNYIKNQDVKIYKLEPYNHENHILKREHLIRTWCNLYNITWDGSMPQIYLNPLELEYAKINLSSYIKSQYDNAGIKKDPNGKILLIQSNGGDGKRLYSWFRDMPAANVNDVVEYFNKDYTLLQIGYDNQLKNDRTLRVGGDLRFLFCTILLADKRLLIDSFGQHAAAALNKPSVVTWVGNKPEVFGYGLHKNIVTSAERVFDIDYSTYLGDFDISGEPLQFPYNTMNLFNSADIINALVS